ncbi:thioredoxin domain-containing protein [Enterovirga rhinocerotis]|uniref:Protein-disulfide isomerase n=1 Tax=Enterovirga rhinocerotis TaxID=1339210 RepID=A0A4R7C8X3_9HYPH|nr:thioredoxin domain-containing protein [Enterovirga rhinocerotis]TDR93775.1 protein-disulfide isomerase [Enterovirga rhinocerotis]
MIDRRSAVAGAIAALAAAPVLGREIASAELLKPGPIEDIWLGPATAKVTIIEYASLTCSRCGEFHRTTWPALKARYIDPGHARFAMRAFPLDPLSTAAFMLARSEPSRFYEVVDLLFERQRDWAYADNPAPSLRKVLEPAGFTQERIDRVLRDQTLLDGVQGVRDRAAKTFGVNATPTFFINGQRRQGALSIEDFDAAIKPILGL